MVNLNIDGKQVQVPEGTTVLRAAEAAGIKIPTLCDHPALKPLGGCRLCLVEVEGARTLQTSCTLPVSEKMVVHTATDKVLAARQFVLSLIFSERNHFCPYCQVSGGDCDLQNAALDEGMTHWPLVPNWQPFPVDASSPYFVIDHNRCILCQRCIRACGDLAGNFTLGLEERGTYSFLVADFGVPIGESSCVSCGTCVQVCPTGAIVGRRSAYQGHEYQSDRVKSVCVGCSVGCSMEVWTRDNRLVRIDGDWDGVVNGGLLCKEGRFIPMEEDRYRINSPMLRQNGELKPASWEASLDAIKDHLKPLIGKNGKGVAAIASTRLPAESLSLFQQVFAEGMKSDLVTSMEEGFPTGLAATLAEELGRPFEGRLDAVEKSDCVVVVGTDLAQDHMVAGFLVKRMLPGGAAKLIVISPEENGLDFHAAKKLRTAKDLNADVIMGLQAAVVKLNLAKEDKPAFDADAVLKAAVEKTGVAEDEFMGIAKVIGEAQSPVFIYGKSFISDTPVETLKALVALTKLTGAAIINVKGKANSLAAAQYGLDKPFTLNGQQAVYVALGDDRPSNTLIERVKGVPFLVVQASYESELTAMADVVLPVEMWAELEGHYLNLEGRLQKTNKVLKAHEQTRSNEEVLQAVASGLGLKADSNWKDRLLRRVSAVAITED